MLSLFSYKENFDEIPSTIVDNNYLYHLFLHRIYAYFDYYDIQSFACSKHQHRILIILEFVLQFVAHDV